ncbi:FRG domain-containing protein [Proteiniclasticum sp. C24MP]|uniref:FRG domain-containing protein n=1 Tax=Proteiniclasticum sp. C24MP TaxID=3374101 RepID=UPI003754570E
MKLYDNEIIKHAIYYGIVKKLIKDSYCDINRYIKSKRSKEEQKIALSNIDSPYIQVVKNPNPKNADELINSLNYIEYSSNTNKINPIQMKEEEIYTLIRMLLSLSTYQESDSQTAILLKFIGLSLKAHEINEPIENENGIVYFKNHIALNFVDSICTFSKLIKNHEMINETSFFRGQTNVNHILQPSIMRSNGYIKNERKMYNELLISSPEYFEINKSHLEVLVEMQHYGLPTRLLDITNNPLVALYFSCNGDSKMYGEVIVFSEDESKIKYSQSDTVTILASLPLFTYDEQVKLYEYATDSSIDNIEFNTKCKRLLHEVKSEKPAFRDEIKKEDLLCPLIVLPLKKNRRIIKQDGAFIICGLSKGDQNLNLNELRYKSRKQNKMQIFIITNKESILKELNSFSINRATLFPEIDAVAEHIKTRYLKNI